MSVKNICLIAATTTCRDILMFSCFYLLTVCLCLLCQLDGQNVPLEVHLLKLVANVDGVVQLFDYFDKPDSFVVVVDRKP